MSETIIEQDGQRFNWVSFRVPLREEDWYFLGRRLVLSRGSCEEIIDCFRPAPPSGGTVASDSPDHIGALNEAVNSFSTKVLVFESRLESEGHRVDGVVTNTGKLGDNLKWQWLATKSLIEQREKAHGELEKRVGLIEKNDQCLREFIDKDRNEMRERVHTLEHPPDKECPDATAPPESRLNFRWLLQRLVNLVRDERLEENVQGDERWGYCLRALKETEPVPPGAGAPPTKQCAALPLTVEEPKEDVLILRDADGRDIETIGRARCKNTFRLLVHAANTLHSTGLPPELWADVATVIKGVVSTSKSYTDEEMQAHLRIVNSRKT